MRHPVCFPAHQASSEKSTLKGKPLPPTPPIGSKPFPFRVPLFQEKGKSNFDKFVSSVFSLESVSIPINMEANSNRPFKPIYAEWTLQQHFGLVHFQ